MTAEADRKHLEEGYAAFSKDPTSKNPYVGTGATSNAVAWGLGFYAASEDYAASKRKEPAQ